MVNDLQPRRRERLSQEIRVLLLGLWSGPVNKTSPCDDRLLVQGFCCHNGLCVSKSSGFHDGMTSRLDRAKWEGALASRDRFLACQQNIASARIACVCKNLPSSCALVQSIWILDVHDGMTPRLDRTKGWEGGRERLSRKNHVFLCRRLLSSG